ncbi:MAG: hypothetical protein NDI61_02335 [Bdellovibrionaceae bacterium]|nr:hypothetical protein [Pseudobdellovibrionaceae bacterium]
MHTHLNQFRKSQDEKHLRAVHAQTCQAAERLKSCEAELIRCLQEVDRLLVHRFLGYNSLFQYSLHALKLSESQSYAYITVARKARELPQLQEAISAGELTVSKAVRITSVINEANQQKWIGLALELPKRDLEREVARENPRAARPEQARFLDAHTLELSTPLSEVSYKKLERVREVMASAAGEWLSLETVIERLSEFYLERKDPVRKAERAMHRVQHNQRANLAVHETSPRESSPVSTRNRKSAEERNVQLDSARARSATGNFEVTEDPSHNSARIQAQSQTLAESTTNPAPRTIPASVVHQIHARDRGRCQARLPGGGRCAPTPWPVA